MKETFLKKKQTDNDPVVPKLFNQAIEQTIIIAFLFLPNSVLVVWQNMTNKRESNEKLLQDWTAQKGGSSNNKP